MLELKKSPQRHTNEEAEKESEDINIMRKNIRGEVLGCIFAYHMEKQKRSKRKIKPIEIPRHDAPEKTLVPIVKFMNDRGITMDIEKMRAELKREEKTWSKGWILSQAA